MFQIGESATYHNVSQIIPVIIKLWSFPISYKFLKFLLLFISLSSIYFIIQTEKICFVRWVDVLNGQTHATTSPAKGMKLICCTSQLEMLFQDGSMVATR